MKEVWQVEKERGDKLLSAQPLSDMLSAEHRSPPVSFFVSFLILSSLAAVPGVITCHTPEGERGKTEEG